MHVAFYTFANKDTGYGHFFRCLALAEEAWYRGHSVTFISDRNPGLRYVRFIKAPYLNTVTVFQVNEVTPLDWIVIDLPVEFPPELLSLGVRKCLIDGIGHGIKSDAALCISQGFDSGSKYCAPDYVILRRDAAATQVVPSPCDGIFVFGGAADKLGIVPKFLRSCQNIKANIILTDISEDIDYRRVSTKHRVYRMNDSRIFTIMKRSRSAVCHMGVVVWECVYQELAPKIFSYSRDHLKDANRLESAGYGLSYGKVGLPVSDIEFRDFVERPINLRGKPLDGLGAERVIRLLEQT